MFDSIIMHISPISYSDGVFTIMTHKDFNKPTINNRYMSEIIQSLRSASNPYNLEIIEVIVVSPEDFTGSHIRRNPGNIENYDKTNLRARYIFETFV